MPHSVVIDRLVEVWEDNLYRLSRARLGLPFYSGFTSSRTGYGSGRLPTSFSLDIEGRDSVVRCPSVSPLCPPSVSCSAEAPAAGGWLDRGRSLFLQITLPAVIAILLLLAGGWAYVKVGNISGHQWIVSKLTPVE